MALLLERAGSLGPSTLGRDNCRGTLQQGVTVVESCGAACKADGGCDCGPRCVWQKWKRGGREGFWNVRRCGKTHGSRGVMFLRWKGDQRSGGASSKGTWVTPGAKVLMLPQRGFAAGWMTQFGCFGKSESGAGKSQQGSCLSSRTKEEALSS